MNFKEVIRKEIVEKISQSLDIVYRGKKTSLEKDMESRPLDASENSEDFEDHYFSDEEDELGFKKETIDVQKSQGVGTGTMKRKGTMKQESGLAKFTKSVVDFFFESKQATHLDSAFKYYGN